MNLNNSLRQVRSLFFREMKILQLNVPLILLLFASPILYSFLYTLMFVNKMERDVPVAVIDNDHSSKSRELIRNLDAHEMIRVDKEYTSIDEAYKSFLDFKIMGLIVIPDGFQNKIKKGLQAKISVTVNNTRFMIANDIVRGVNDVLSSVANNAVADFFHKKNGGTTDPNIISQPLLLNSKLLFSTTESYGDFIIVGLLALILQQTLLIMVASSMAHENEFGTTRDLIHKASSSVMKILVGKTGFYLFIYCIYAFLFYTLHYLLFKIPFEGSIGVLGILTVFQFSTIIIIGLLIGTFLSSKLYALIIIVFTSYPIFLLSGYSWPFQAFPPILQMFAYLLPQTSYFQAYTIITQNGGNFSDVIQPLIRICALGCIFFAVLFFRFKYLRRKLVSIKSV